MTETERQAQSDWQLTATALRAENNELRERLGDAEDAVRRKELARQAMRDVADAHSDELVAYRTTVRDALLALRAEIKAHDARNPEMPEHGTALAWCVEVVDVTLAALGLAAEGEMEKL